MRMRDGISLSHHSPQHQQHDRGFGGTVTSPLRAVTIYRAPYRKLQRLAIGLLGTATRFVVHVIPQKPYVCDSYITDKNPYMPVGDVSPTFP